jgi:hypothetical protein
MSAAVLALLLAAAPAAPEGAPPQAAPGAEAQAVAAVLVDRRLYDQLIETMSPVVGMALEGQARAAGGYLKVSGAGLARSVLGKVMPIEGLRDFYADLVARRFTPAELAEVGAFLRTEAGKKYALLAVDGATDMKIWVQARMEEAGPELRRQLEGAIVLPAREGPEAQKAGEGAPGRP